MNQRNKVIGETIGKPTSRRVTWTPEERRAYLKEIEARIISGARQRAREADEEAHAVENLRQERDDAFRKLDAANAKIRDLEAQGPRVFFGVGPAPAPAPAPGLPATGKTDGK